MHIENFKRSGLSGVVSHIERTDNKKNKKRDYSNENIDKEKTHLNYDLIKKGSVETINKRLETLKGKKEYRSDANLLSSLVVQIPRDENGNLTITDEEKQKEFFNGILGFANEKFGKENIMVASVHMDETTPHIHCCFVPEKEGKVSCKKVVNRYLLKTMHSDCEKYLEAHLGYKVKLRNEDALTKENLNMKEYKVKKKMEELDKTLNEKLDKIKDVQVYEKDLKGNVKELEVKFNELKNHSPLLKKEELENIKNNTKPNLLGKVSLDKDTYNNLLENNLNVSFELGRYGTKIKELEKENAELKIKNKQIDIQKENVVDKALLFQKEIINIEKEKKTLKREIFERDVYMEWKKEKEDFKSFQKDYSKDLNKLFNKADDFGLDR